MTLFIAVPLALLAAAFGGVFGALAIVSPRYPLALMKVLTSRKAWQEGWMGSVSEPTTPASALLRTLARAIGAFAGARLVLLAFGLGPLTSVAVVITTVLIAWDYYWFAFLGRMSFQAPAAAVQMQRRRVLYGVIVSLLVAFLFIKT